MHPVILLILLAALLFGFSWYKRAPSARRGGIRNMLLVVGGLLLVALLAVRGGPQGLIAGAGVLGLMALRLLKAVQVASALRGAWQQWGPDQRPTPGQASSVATGWLRMSLDHDSGEMDGEILAGRHQGRRLSELGLEELLHVRVEAAGDARTLSLLDAYLDRVHGDAWRERGGAAGFGEDLTEAEAREILGVEPGATREEIVEAHRRLMQRMHPDRGGSTYLAAKINRAKDLLLGE